MFFYLPPYAKDERVGKGTMNLSWIGESRPLIEALFQWGNQYAAAYHKQIPVTENLSINSSEYQVIEYLLENEELQLNMAGVARRLGVSPVTFSVNIAKLEKLGLVKKYYHENNRKDIVVLVTDLGREVYDLFSDQLSKMWDDGVLDLLAQIPSEHQETFRQVLCNLTRYNCGVEQLGRQLKPLEEKRTAKRD